MKAIMVLLIEDNPGDARMIREVSSEDPANSLQIEHADTLAKGLARLAEGGIDVVLLDLALPDSMGHETFVRLQGACPQIPVVVMTGLHDDALAVQMVQEGAQDYLEKGGLDYRLLTRTIRYAFERKHAILEKDHLIAQLQDALAKVSVLSGLLPICASCKKIRNDGGYWQQVEEYIQGHSDAIFSHGICPECARRIYPSLFPNGSASGSDPK